MAVGHIGQALGRMRPVGCPFDMTDLKHWNLIDEHQIDNQIVRLIKFFFSPESAFSGSISSSVPTAALVRYHLRAWSAS